jgi:hypothetical protein
MGYRNLKTLNGTTINFVLEILNKGICIWASEILKLQRR